MSEQTDTQQIRKEVSATVTDLAVLNEKVAGLSKTVDSNHVALMKGQEEIKGLFKNEVFPRIQKVENRVIWMGGFAAGIGFLGSKVWDWITSKHP
jgi:allophanate hydrolase subunit 1